MYDDGDDNEQAMEEYPMYKHFLSFVLVCRGGVGGDNMIILL